MAALDRRNPNLDDFVGLNWSCWVDGVNILQPDAESHPEDCSKHGRNLSETMTLRKEDMHIYGHCPAHDEIYLVVCSHCGQVVKPQAFEKHCERRHGPLTKMCGPSSALSSQQKPRPRFPTSDLSTCREKQKDNSSYGATASAALPVHQRRPNKDSESFPSTEKLPQESPPSIPLQSSSTPHPRVTLGVKCGGVHSGPLPPGHCSSSTSPPERQSAQRPTAGQSSKSQSPLRGTRTYSRIHKNTDKKECELNKHTGGLDPKKKKLCTRELICNSDSIQQQQQQKAGGRTKTFDHPRLELKAASAGHMDQPSVKNKEKPHLLEAMEDKITQNSPYNYSGDCHILRSRSSLESFAEEESDSMVEVEVQPPYPFNQTLPSSDEDEADEQEDTADLPATPWHPKPLGLCTFGCRTFGCSIFTFDRRWHHLRFALSTMLERHVKKHLMKKMPQAASGFRSRHHTPLDAESPAMTGARHTKSSHSLSLDSTSLGLPETKTSHHYSHRNKQPSSTASSNLSSVQLCSSPVGRSSKAQSKEAGLMHESNIEGKSSNSLKDQLFYEKSQPHTPSSKGHANGSFLHEKKPCLLLHSGRPPGNQQKVTNCDRCGPTKKRKGRKESIPLSSSLSRTSKCQRLSSPLESNILAWKGQNSKDVLAWGWEKKSES